MKNDSFRHKGLREKLVQEVRSKGIQDERVLQALHQVPRHLFMDAGFINFAYKDQAFPIGEGQTISQPYTVAFQTELLDVHTHHKILEVGTGSGYQAAVLIEMGARVYTIERQRKLFLKTQSLLQEMGYKAKFFFGDGFKGVPAFAPYDRILITAAIPEIPGELLNQLKEGGKMVLPMGGALSQRMILLVKTGPDAYEQSSHGHFVFVPMLKGTSNGTNQKG
jgi:protein-L-isoaspartate(D-aspartate) O-methyltransferase